MAFPTWASAVGLDGSTSDLLTTGPAHSIGDVIVLCVETASQAVVLTDPNWGDEVASSPQDNGGAPGAGSGHRITVITRVAASSAEPNPTVANSGDHQVACAFVIHHPDGTPVIDAQVGGLTGGGATQTLAGPTSTGPDRLVVLILGTTNNSTESNIFSNETNANLANITPRIDGSHTAGQGGGFMVTTGEKATAGAVGNTTVDCVNTNAGGYIVLAFGPPSAGPPTAHVFPPRDHRLAYLRI